jgi:hypothetical protein
MDLFISVIKLRRFNYAVSTETNDMGILSWVVNT